MERNNLLTGNRFHIGDHVVTHTPQPGIPAGTVGTIVRVYVSATDCYDVRIDGDRTPHMIYGSSLMLLPFMKPQSIYSIVSN